MTDDTSILIQVDKTVVRITGLSVKGLNIKQLEKAVASRLDSVVRIIGVTGSSIEMDVYGMDETDILTQKDGLIKALAIADGIMVSDVTHLASVEKIKTVHIDDVPPPDPGGCRGERWMLIP